MQLTKEYMEKNNRAFEEMKKLVDSGKAESAEGKEKLEKMNLVMDKLEETNQKFVKEQQEAKTLSAEIKELVETQKAGDAEKILEQKSRIDALELAMAHGSVGDVKKYKESDEFKAFEFMYKTGSADQIHALPDMNKKSLMRTDSNVEGGFLIPRELDSVLRKQIIEISGIRSIARVRTMSVKSLEIAIRNSNLVATYEGEAESDSDSVSNFRNETITPYRQSVTVPFTSDVLMDSSFDLEEEIAKDVATAFAQGEGLNHVLGDGIKKPEGFLQNAAIIASARAGITGVAGKLHADDIILLTGDLKAGYDPTYVFNRKTLAQIRTLKGEGPNGAASTFGDGQYLWQPAMNGQASNTIAGDPYLIASDMPDVASNALAIAYGDFRRGYEIFDRTGTMLIRDVFTKKKQAIIELTFMRWNTGRVIIPEAITALKIAAA